MDSYHRDLWRPKVAEIRRFWARFLRARAQGAGRVSYLDIAEAALDQWRPRIVEELKEFLANFEPGFDTIVRLAMKISDDSFCTTTLWALLRREVRYSFYIRLLKRGIPDSVAGIAMSTYDIDFYVPDEWEMDD